MVSFAKIMIQSLHLDEIEASAGQAQTGNTVNCKNWEEA
jgi:hypothetical protein